MLSLFVALSPLPAMAQMQTLVVPAGSGVVIAPRGQAMPRPSIAPPSRAQRRLVLQAEPADTLTAPSAAVAVALAGAAALAVALGGAGGGSNGTSATTATTRTR